MMPRTHRHLRLQVSAYIDGELDPVATIAVERHIARCWDCSTAAGQFRLIKASLARLGRDRPDALGAARLRRWATALIARPD